MKKRSITLTIFLIFFTEVNLKSAQEDQYDLGQFYPMVQNYANNQPMRFSFLAKEWPDVEQWRISARAKMFELLSYQPESVPLDPESCGWRYVGEGGWSRG